MIRTKSIYDDSEEDDGIRVLITRYYPRFWKKADYKKWFRELSPSASLLKKYKRGQIDWTEFSRSFRKELLSKSTKDILENLALSAVTDNVTLLCYEREGEKCHRHIVSAVISRKMVKVQSASS